ncbi:Beta-barrel assembly-enhancing protease [Methylovirgula sp. HY1]|nr:Beta-barrel assembly-enhancing protease [Methylovirgula sp. HY1]
MRMPLPTCFAPSARWMRAPTSSRQHQSMACVVAAALMLTGCQSFGQNGDITGSIPSSQSSVAHSQEALFRYTQALGQRYESNPNDKRVALTYAHALRQLSRYAQAVAVLQRLAATHPKDMDVLGEYGKALVDAGRLQEAADVLPQAHTPENPDWTILSAQGSVADQLGDHAKAQEYYAAALKIVPNQPDVLSNLGLSYALSKQLPMAEKTLRLAVAQPGARARVRQNLALVLALEGKFDAAQTIEQRDLPPLQAAENVAAVRQMIAQANPWTKIRALDGEKTGRVASRKGVPRKLAFAKPAGKQQTALNGKAPWMDAARPVTASAE